MAAGGAVNKENPSMKKASSYKHGPIEPFTKGPQGRRRYPGQNQAAQKRRDAMLQAEQKRKDRELQEARRRFDASSESDSPGYKKGGKVKSSASKRADGCAVKGKTRGKMV